MAGNAASATLCTRPIVRLHRGKEPIPLAVALLYHPLATYASLLLAVVCALYAVQARGPVPAVTCAVATLLALLAFLQTPPSLSGLTWFAVAVVLLHAEFLWPTFGLAAVLGVGSAAWGSFLLLAPLETPARVAAAVVGALLVLAAIARTMRLRTLPR